MSDMVCEQHQARIKYYENTVNRSWGIHTGHKRHRSNATKTPCGAPRKLNPDSECKVIIKIIVQFISTKTC